MVSLSAQSMKVLRERVPLFAQFEDAELATIMHRSRRRVLKDGDVLIAEGTLATKLFVLVSGQAAVYRSLAGKSELIATLKPGATVGEIGIVDRAPRSAQVTAVGNTVILEMELSVLEDCAMEMRMKLYRNLSLILANRVRATNDTLDEIAQPGGSLVLQLMISLYRHYRDASMVGIRAEGADFSQGTFTGANFANANFDGAVFTNASFRGAELSGVRFDDEDYMIGGGDYEEPDSLAATLQTGEESEEE